MKRVPLKTLPDPRFPDDAAQAVDYRVVIEQAIRVPFDRQSGATIDEMRKGIRVLDALEATEDGELNLEDADWEYLKQKIEKMPWAMVDRRFVEFYDDVTSADNGLHAV
jgi:hypothetical protein